MSYHPVFFAGPRTPEELISPLGIQVVNWTPMTDLYAGELWLDEDIQASVAEKRDATYDWFLSCEGRRRVLFGFEEDPGESYSPALAREILGGGRLHPQVWLVGGQSGTPPAGWRVVGNDVWEQVQARPRWAT
jgi:hypothetical protein